MPKVLPDITYSREGSIPVVDSINSVYKIPMYKTAEYFGNLESYVSFIKSVERIVRTNDRYKKYINYLKKTVGLSACQVLLNVTDDSAQIDMHHGPILTLYDYCAIIVEYFILKNRKISTFLIADAVLDEHHKNRVQVVMLSETVHEEVHQREIFLNYKHAFGNLNEFVSRYKEALTDEYVEKINRYIDRSLMYDSNDYGVLTLSNALWS